MTSGGTNRPADSPQPRKRRGERLQQTLTTLTLVGSAALGSTLGNDILLGTDTRFDFMAPVLVLSIVAPLVPLLDGGRVDPWRFLEPWVAAAIGGVIGALAMTEDSAMRVGLLFLLAVFSLMLYWVIRSTERQDPPVSPGGGPP